MRKAKPDTLLHNLNEIINTKDTSTKNHRDEGTNNRGLKRWPTTLCDSIILCLVIPNSAPTKDGHIMK